MKTPNKEIQERDPKSLITYPAKYQIHIQGRIDIGWSDRLAGMSITTTGGKHLAPLTIIQGELIDQSALLGVLNTLHDLGHALLHLEYLSNNSHQVENPR